MISHDKSAYTEINSKTWDKWAENGCEWTIPITHEQFLAAKNEGKCEVFLTPCRPVPIEWFGGLQGKRLLGLASAGAQQMPVFAALGAVCTVLDYSDSQLEKERLTAEREGYEIEIIKADMTKRLPFADESFDIIFHPVSNCYVRDVLHIWNECYRILSPGGRLLAGFDNGINFLFDDISKEPLTLKNKLPFDPLSMPDAEFYRMRDNYEAIQFSHSLEEQLGGQLSAGFELRGLFEDRDRDGLLREYTPQYIATLALKP